MDVIRTSEISGSFLQISAKRFFTRSRGALAPFFLTDEDEEKDELRILKNEKGAGFIFRVPQGIATILSVRSLKNLCL